MIKNERYLLILDGIENGKIKERTLFFLSFKHVTSSLDIYYSDGNLLH